MHNSLIFGQKHHITLINQVFGLWQQILHMLSLKNVDINFYNVIEIIMDFLDESIHFKPIFQTIQFH